MKQYLQIGEISIVFIDEIEIAATIANDTASTFSISWRDIVEATKQDTTLSFILSAIREGNIGNLSVNDVGVSQSLQYKDSLYVSDGALMYFDCVIIPVSLCQSILSILHSAHQGVSGMEARAKSLVF